MNRQLKIKIFADGATPELIIQHSNNPLVQGFTTNPSLLKSAGVKDYAAYAKILLQYTGTKPISFEVLSDNIAEMRREALVIKQWGEETGNQKLYVKIPIMNSKRESTKQLVRDLLDLGIKVNITAIFDYAQVVELVPFLSRKTDSIISLFAGRLADVLLNPHKFVADSVALVKDNPMVEVLWASTRQVWSAAEAEDLGCHIITMPFDMIEKLKNAHKSADDLTMAAINDFLKSAKDANLRIL